jgi:hypothetical protein
MNDKEYQETQQSILEIVGKIQALDLKSFLARIEEAQCVGYILDPTLYREVSPNLKDIQDLARSLRAVQENCEIIKDRFFSDFERVQKEAERLGAE